MKMLSSPAACCLFSGLLLTALPCAAADGESPGAVPGIRTEADLEYAKVDGKPLCLDLYHPAGPPLGLVVYVHGGAWSAGSKSDCPIRGLVSDGYAVASVDYRLTRQAPFPANVYDIKAAIRFLRAEADRLSLPADRIVIAGSSAGGHLAALVGLTNGVEVLAGKVGGHPGVSSGVLGVISFFGASNLQTILGQSTEFGLGMRIPALQLLLSGQPRERPQLAALASPVGHVDPTDPPVLMFHGDEDPQMPLAQSEELLERCVKVGVAAKLHVVRGGKHGGPGFYDAAQMQLVREFLAEAFKAPLDRPAKR